MRRSSKVGLVNINDDTRSSVQYGSTNLGRFDSQGSLQQLVNVYVCVDAVKMASILCISNSVNYYYCCVFVCMVPTWRQFLCISDFVYATEICIKHSLIQLFYQPPHSFVTLTVHEPLVQCLIIVQQCVFMWTTIFWNVTHQNIADNFFVSTTSIFVTFNSYIFLQLQLHSVPMYNYMQDLSLTTKQDSFRFVLKLMTKVTQPVIVSRDPGFLYNFILIEHV